MNIYWQMGVIAAAFSFGWYMHGVFDEAGRAKKDDKIIADTETKQTAATTIDGAAQDKVQIINNADRNIGWKNTDEKTPPCVLPESTQRMLRTFRETARSASR